MAQDLASRLGVTLEWVPNTIFDEIIAGRADVMITDASETVWVVSTHPQLCAVHPDKPFDFSQKRDRVLRRVVVGYDEAAVTPRGGDRRCRR